jgi:hypothetical protein
MPAEVNQGIGNTNANPSTTFSITPRSNDIIGAYITSDAAVAFSAGPSFSTGTTNNQPLVESNSSGTIEDLIAGYVIPGSSASQIYSGTFTASNDWTAEINAYKAAGNLDTVAPTNSTAQVWQMTLNDWATWETGYTVAAQTIAAGTYTFTYSTNNPTGTNNVTATMTFGYSSSSVCGTITTIASWSATLLDGVSNSTTSTTTASSSTIPANSYLCWKVTVTAVGNKTLGLDYDSTSFQTNISTPDISVPEIGLALLGLALVAPVAARWRRRPR